MAFDDRPITAHEKEQQVFSDMRFDPSGTKDFKQISRQDYLDQISGQADEAAEKKFSEFATGMAEANAQLTKQREEMMIRLNGIEISETNVRKTASFFRDNMDMLAAANGWSDNHRQRIETDLELLENGTNIQQREAFDRIAEYDPEFSEQYLEVAQGFENIPGFSPYDVVDFETPTQDEPTNQNAFSTFQMQ